MRIPTKRIDLKDLGYEDYYVVVPRSVKEGFVYELSKVNTDVTGEAQAAVARDVNIRFLDLVIEWNLDDDKGTVLPLTRLQTGKDALDKKSAIAAEVPVDIIREMVDQMTASTRVGARAQDF